MLKEGQELAEQIQREEEEKEAQAQAQDDEDKADHEMRYKRLTHLLDRSKFYANFLLQRMATKKEEEKIKVKIYSNWNPLTDMAHVLLLFFRVLIVVCLFTERETSKTTGTQEGKREDEVTCCSKRVCGEGEWWFYFTASDAV